MEQSLDKFFGVTYNDDGSVRHIARYGQPSYMQRAQIVVYRSGASTSEYNGVKEVEVCVCLVLWCFLFLFYKSAFICSLLQVFVQEVIEKVETQLKFGVKEVEVCVWCGAVFYVFFISSTEVSDFMQLLNGLVM